MKNILILIISIIITIATTFLSLFTNGVLTLQTLPCALIYLISAAIIYYMIMDINFNLIRNSDSVLYRKYKIFKFFYLAESENKLNNFEKFCIESRNLYLYMSIAGFVNNIELEDLIIKIRKRDFNSIIENSTIKNKKTLKILLKQLKYWYDTFDMPQHGALFIQYYDKSLLSKKNSLFQILFGFISLILSVVSLIGLNSFLQVNWIVYVIFFMPIIILIIGYLISHNKDKEGLCKVYEDEYLELINLYNEYNEKNSYKPCKKKK